MQVRRLRTWLRHPVHTVHRQRPAANSRSDRSTIRSPNVYVRDPGETRRKPLPRPPTPLTPQRPPTPLPRTAAGEQEPPFNQRRTSTVDRLECDVFWRSKIWTISGRANASRSSGHPPVFAPSLSLVALDRLLRDYRRRRRRKYFVLSPCVRAASARRLPTWQVTIDALCVNRAIGRTSRFVKRLRTAFRHAAFKAVLISVLTYANRRGAPRTASGKNARIRHETSDATPRLLPPAATRCFDAIRRGRGIEDSRV